MDNKIIIECECGRPYKKCYIKSHLQSNEHKYFLKYNRKINYPKYVECEEKYYIGKNYQECIKIKARCECGRVVSNNRDAKRGHEKTNYHIQYMKCPKGGSFQYYISKYENNG